MGGLQLQKTRYLHSLTTANTMTTYRVGGGGGTDGTSLQWLAVSTHRLQRFQLFAKMENGVCVYLRLQNHFKLLAKQNQCKQTKKTRRHRIQYYCYLRLFLSPLNSQGMIQVHIFSVPH